MIRYLITITPSGYLGVNDFEQFRDALNDADLANTLPGLISDALSCDPDWYTVDIRELPSQLTLPGLGVLNAKA